MFKIDLNTQVAAYSASKTNWGGPASCQMAMNGYPTGAKSCFVSQAQIWNYIQTHNKEPGKLGPGGVFDGWYSDPFAVTKALNDLCPPQHSWIDVSDSNKEVVLYKLFRFMANYKYTSLVCLSNHDYWVTMVSYRTSDDPRVVPNTTLLEVGIQYPYYLGVLYKKISGALWMNSSAYWKDPVPTGKIWKNKWVGIGEPPEEDGKIRVDDILRVGKSLINPKDAAQIARRYIAEQRREKSAFLLKYLNGVQGTQPMLVREQSLKQTGREPEEDVRYYVVPFGNRYEVDETGARLARLSVLVNAYTGEFEELCVFPRPVRYLTEREVLLIATRNLGLSRREVNRVEAELVFRPLLQYVSSDSPAWKITFDGQTFFVTQTGIVLGTLSYPGLLGA